jgi:hypothetical protein
MRCYPQEHALPEFVVNNFCNSLITIYSMYLSISGDIVFHFDYKRPYITHQISIHISKHYKLQQIYISDISNGLCVSIKNV